MAVVYQNYNSSYLNISVDSLGDIYGLDNELNQWQVIHDVILRLLLALVQLIKATLEEVLLCDLQTQIDTSY